MPSFDLFGLKSGRKGQNSAIIQIRLKTVVMEYNAGCQPKYVINQIHRFNFLAVNDFSRKSA